MSREVVQDDIEQVNFLVRKVLKEQGYKNIERMGGLTNHTYKVELMNGKVYVVRIPGEGTEDLIVRKDEKTSTELACKLKIDAKLLYFGADGSKVTEYIPDAVTMSRDSLKKEKNIKEMASILKKLHNSGVDTGVPFEVFDMAAGYEQIISDNQVTMYEDYDAVKTKVMNIKKEIDSELDIKKVPCHNDSLCENWVLGSDRMYLIDWEYAGMNDGVWDLADTSIEAEFDKVCDKRLLTEYYGRPITKSDWKHLLANKVYVDYLWTLWAKTRVPFDGQPMEDWATERYARLKVNLEAYENI